MRWGDLGLRIGSAAVLVPIALACLWLGGIAWAVLIGLAGVGVAVEWIGLVRGRALLLGGGLAWFALAGAALLWLRADPDAGLRLVLFLLLVVWASDSCAYLAGRLIGGPPLAPAISPRKTWAGAGGGLLGAGLVGLLLPWPLAAWAAVALALVLGMAAQAGDLLESWLKRRAGVKDSGRLIPGHGGLLDRLDGLMAAAPLAAALAAILHGDGWR